jgi:hypothetical protein
LAFFGFSPATGSCLLFCGRFFNRCFLCCGFFYHNLDDIGHRYPNIRKGFRRLIQLKRAALLAICANLLQQAVIETDEQQVMGLVDNMTLTLTFWFNYDLLINEGRSPAVTIHQGVLQLMTMVAPYLGDEQLTFYRDCEAIYASMPEVSGQGAQRPV